VIPVQNSTARVNKRLAPAGNRLLTRAALYRDDQLDWVGGEFDPDAFDLDAINEELKQIK
jgi:hypothetical protein